MWQRLKMDSVWRPEISIATNEYFLGEGQVWKRARFKALEISEVRSFELRRVPPVSGLRCQWKPPVSPPFRRLRYILFAGNRVALNEDRDGQPITRMKKVGHIGCGTPNCNWEFALRDAAARRIDERLRKQRGAGSIQDVYHHDKSPCFSTLSGRYS